jgi:hypothetical protein
MTTFKKDFDIQLHTWPQGPGRTRVGTSPPPGPPPPPDLNLTPNFLKSLLLNFAGKNKSHVLLDTLIHMATKNYFIYYITY